MNHASEKLTNIEQIRRLLSDLDRIGLWKPSKVTDQSSIEDAREETIRILSLIETELERSGLWDRNINDDGEIGNVAEAGHSLAQTISIEQIASRAKTAIRLMNAHKSGN